MKKIIKIAKPQIMMKPLKAAQSGIALVSALLLLLAMTLVGVSSLRMNLNSEEMASNTYLRDQALQAAQLALEYGESYVRAQPTLIADRVFFGTGGADNDFDSNNIGDRCTDGLCIPLNYVSSFTPSSGGQWVQGNSNDVWQNGGRHIVIPAGIANSFNLQNAPFQPMFIIEFMGHTQPVQNGEQIASRCDIKPQDGIVTSAEGRVEYPFCLSDPRLFRITARGTSGAVGNPVEVFLQSTLITP